MDISQLLSLSGLLLSSYIFYLYAKRVNKEELTLNGFMCADGNLNKSQFSATFAASNFSLAMTLMYLLGNAKYLGWFLLISPATYLLGHYLFIYLIDP
jgi:Na+/proline symporter